MSEEDESRAENWHAKSARGALAELGVEAERGLSDAEAQARLEHFGSNQLQEAESKPWWRILLEQFQTIVVYLLGAAAVLAFATGRIPEGIAVVAVIVVNTAIGFVSELKAVRSMAALRQLGQHETCVVREGEETNASAVDLVPGDIVVLRAGDLVPADHRVVEAEHLRVNEAPLTGESVPADKTSDAVAADTELAERSCMLHKGTTIADGRVRAVTVATGQRTELGRISQLAEEAESTVTPLQKRLDQLGQRLAWLVIAIAAGVAVLGLFIRQQETTLVLETALALGIAAIPEGLPIVATIALARGMYLMAKRNALVNQLTAVEALGTTGVIFSDKTGTLTENRMQLRHLAAPGCDVSIEEDSEPELGEPAKRALRVGVLCNGASLGDDEDSEGEPKGDPTEIAILSGARRVGMSRAELLVQLPEARVEEFEPRIKKMATYHQDEQQYYVAVKGAPGAVLEVCESIVDEGGDQDSELDAERAREWQKRAEQLAGQGLRVLALADKKVESEQAEPYEGLRFVGLVGMVDPPREGAKAAIDRCQAAGIRVEMITGDQPATAQAIAEAVGIVGDESDPEAKVIHGRDMKPPEELDERDIDEIHQANIFARVSPEQKLNLVSSYQERGDIVAMTGDGVNDAPALKKADIGVAMGKRGTEAAKQVADMVLQDDAFETIVAAVEQGRVIFANIRKSVMFMLTTNVAEVMAVTAATVAGWTLPLQPLQILYLNVLTDVLPALALGVGPASGHEMVEPPRRPDEAVLTRAHWLELIGLATLFAGCVVGSMLIAQRMLGMDDERAVTVSFLTIAFGKLWFTFALRGERSGPFDNEITRNVWVWAAIGVCIVLLLAAVYVPPLSQLLNTQAPEAAGWGLLLAMSLVPALAGQVLRTWQRGR